jgi:phage shock protein C
METPAKRLARSRTDRVFGGVCGGVAEYLGWDSVVVRVVYVALTILSLGIGGMILYAFAWLLMPQAEPGVGLPPEAVQPRRSSTRIIVGALLVVAGMLALMALFLPTFLTWTGWRFTAPALLVILGLLLIFSNREPIIAVPRGPLSGPIVVGGPEPEPVYTRPRLRRLRRGRKIAGISAGLGEYLGIDTTIIRLLWVVLLFFGGAGLLLYLILWIVMPLED